MEIQYSKRIQSSNQMNSAYGFPQNNLGFKGSVNQIMDNFNKPLGFGSVNQQFGNRMGSVNQAMGSINPQYNLVRSVNQQMNNFDQPNKSIDNSYNPNRSLNATRKEDLNKSKMEEISQNPKIYSFFNDQFLADCILKLQEGDKTFHSVILSSASEYIYDYFKNGNVQKDSVTNKFIIPLPEQNYSEMTIRSLNTSDILNLIFKYCYSNQNFEFIEPEINVENIFALISFAHSLRIKNLMKALENKIVKEHLNVGNCFKLIKEALIFELPFLKENSLNIIIRNFMEINNGGNEEFILNLNYDTFKEIVSSDYLKISDEKEVAELVIKYIRKRRELPEVNEGINLMQQQNTNIQQNVVIEQNIVIKQEGIENERYGEKPEIDTDGEEKKEPENKTRKEQTR
ncbi:MAG: germ cell-less family protein [archaeon]|nr:germ cell-less family protein [archaeon]